MAITGKVLMLKRKSVIRSPLATSVGSLLRRLVWSLRKHQFSKFVHKSSKDSFASLHLKQSLSNPRSLKSSIPNTSPEQTRRSSSREKEEEKAIESPSQVWRHREKLKH
ncbi:hypothetical protein F2Q68_00036045 [Brassica cretica]|uniref:Uncharacterized protein n=1 Tax=Brassica cretica TaxID=69181 RepID=A0A8S9GYC1_BRACR|nr:hypothetical protein F2Q68_00036045 [Brassica cretica]